MNNKYLEIRKQAQDFLSELTITDGDAFIANTLFELSETDNTNIEIKEHALNEIKKLLEIKRKLKTLENDLYFFKTLSEQLKLENPSQIKSSPLIKVINALKEEKYFITLEAANKYISTLEDKNNIMITRIENDQLDTLLNIIKRNF